MSARLARVLATTGATALALTLVTPAAALAADGDSGKSGSAAADHHKGDPAGNNGTIKIDYAAPADSGHANRPHPGCAFQLRMFNFDDDQTGTITFVGQAPTKLGTLLTQSGKLLSDDAAGGGQDVDAVYSYTAADLGLTDQPQAKQGWHIKVSVDADDAPGGAKHKVFWLKCPTSGTTTGGAAAPATATTTGGEAAPATTGTGAGTGADTTTTTSTSTTSTSVTSTATKTEQLTELLQGAASGAATGVTAQSVTSGETPFTGGAAAAAVTAGGQARGTALPFTGVPVLGLLALALGTLAAGALAVRAGRRRTSAV